jgi:acyl dehydratase
MTAFAGVDGLRAAVGTHLGFSDWHEIRQERVDLFADATDDHQWIHIDPERAAAGPFGGTVAHGFLTLSLLPLLVHEVYTVEGLRMIVNYGLNRVRFPTPVPVGARVRAGVELEGVDAASAGSLATTKVTVELEGSAKPACVAELLSLLVE